MVISIDPGWVFRFITKIIIDIRRQLAEAEGAASEMIRGPIISSGFNSTAPLHAMLII